ncbi:MAG: hypothetical protein OJF49_002512 [Ktedonobacterales bacterium]|jgi:hypothetical protein|nr:MAG: hypothetical protein OJF49_002512 [Ktedonobacterales bacterium]
MMALFRDFMRFVALAVGLVAGLLALLIDLGALAFAGKTHPGWGLLIVLIGIAGALIAPFSGRYAALLMLFSAIAFFFAVGAGAAVSSVFFIIAAALAYFDRSRAKAVQAA